MDNRNETKSLLKAAIPKSVTVNKLWVWIAVMAVVVIIAFAIIGAFRQSHRFSKKTSQTKLSQNLTPTVSQAVSALPKDYQDVKKIKQYLNQDNNQKLPKVVQAELDALRAQQAALEQRLSMLNNQPGTPSQTEASMRDQQAKSSGLFFPGNAPSTTAFSSNVQTTKTSTSSNTSSASSAGTTPYEKQNMQTQKANFFKSSNEDSNDIYDPHTLVKPASPYEVQAGSLIPTVLITAINTSSPGEAVAQVREDIYDSVTGRFLLIPKGSKLIGQYDSQVAYGQTRVLLAFTRVIRPDGSSILLDKMKGADLLGAAGVKGDIDNHWMRVLGAATLSTLLSVGTGVASDRLNTGNNAYYRNAESNAALGAASNISSVGQQLTGQAINVQPTITLPAGYEFNVIVNKDIIMEPYHKRTG